MAQGPVLLCWHRQNQHSRLRLWETNMPELALLLVCANEPSISFLLWQLTRYHSNQFRM